MKRFDWSKEAAVLWDDQADFWNKRSKNMWESGSRHQIVPFIKKHSKPNCQQLLDIGCGDGYGAYKLYKEGYRVTGMDLSKKMIDYAQSQLPDEITFIHGDINQLPFDDSAMDGIMAINVLEWTENPDKALDELKRVVREDGFLCVGILGPTAGPRLNSFPRLHNQKSICNTMMPWEFQKLCEEKGLQYMDGYGVYKQGVNKAHYNDLPLELKQALSFSWIFLMRNVGE
ncbi:class I SAM-dependent methyltransferase [Virgibacillus sp. AGTR]|uniref:Class I SAM-dependent methyltransferase n=1 Tax=Virgibacillus salarius TaxID=447199 RepID=A0A941IC94_9BACI|nr:MULTISPECIES: class I SAM-dependent methyltransferase [Bacillaceae]NAZ09961.1 methyltransferase domain-containing protein [Agaribacter marinus]MBR7797251.1 class I SAM-dependent methyltransferase [Virgibacillus salarius]MCC2251615.1 class I SAM-dependent methyltransferase [Virgibacillus sp. AGTR]MDY7045912.1 class I SAM-dependent methyltransferase [Virgibacillus sp. M23]QRZ19625.1 class I SAM-dependent methyltransferase [Virgibacillus sp. AGTR]